MGEKKIKKEKRSRTKPKRNGERPLGKVVAKRYAIFKSWPIEKKNEWMNKDRSEDQWVQYSEDYLESVVPYILPELE